MPRSEAQFGRGLTAPVRLSVRLSGAGRSMSAAWLVCAAAAVYAQAPAGAQEQTDTQETARAAGDIAQFAGIEFAWCPPGRYQRGEAGTAEPVHEVTLTRGFWMARRPVTQALWESVMEVNPSRFQGEGTRPVERITWDEIALFVERLNERYPGNNFRIPTEAEWEYACRAGTDTRFSFGDGSTELDRHGWFKENADGSTQPVGTKAPNPWGLFDMHGNVWEFVQDAYGPYPAGPVTDPTGSGGEGSRVLRGGSWFDSAQFCGSAYRVNYWTLYYRYFHVGFRLARDP